MIPEHVGAAALVPTPGRLRSGLGFLPRDAIVGARLRRSFLFFCTAVRRAHDRVGRWRIAVLLDNLTYVGASLVVGASMLEKSLGAEVS
jgi:hypothetical protein